MDPPRPYSYRGTEYESGSEPEEPEDDDGELGSGSDLRRTVEAKRPIEIFIFIAGPGNGPPNLYEGFYELVCRMISVHNYY